MLDAPSATVIAATIALLGTVIGLVIGYRRWQRERTDQRFARFEADRQDIYKSLWDRVEQINASLRRERVDNAGFSELVADLNEFIIRNGAHVDDADYQLVNRYVGAVKQFHDIVSRLPAEDKVPYGQTQTVSEDLVKSMAELRDAQADVGRLREELRKKVRLIIGGVS